MTDFVLDCSVTMAWCFEDETSSYSEAVLDRLTKKKAFVPIIWSLEVSNTLLVAERKKRITEMQSLQFVELLLSLHIIADDDTFQRALKETLSIARNNQLSSYDAAYLELCIRQDMPLATLDNALKKAAKKCGIKTMAMA